MLGEEQDFFGRQHHVCVLLYVSQAIDGSSALLYKLLHDLLKQPEALDFALIGMSQI